MITNVKQKETETDILQYTKPVLRLRTQTGYRPTLGQATTKIAPTENKNKLPSLLPACFASPMGRIGDQSAWRRYRVKVKWKLGEEFLAKPHPWTRVDRTLRTYQEISFRRKPAVLLSWTKQTSHSYKQPQFFAWIWASKITSQLHTSCK